MDGAVPSAFTTLFFIPIIFVAYRYPLPLSLFVVALASVFSSPAMELAGVSLDASVMPVLWLGWPAVYLFLAVSLNQWSSIQQQRGKLEESERGLMDVSERNDRRERELETLSAIHTTILSENGETAVVDEITRRVAEVCGAKICTIVVPVGTTNQRPFLSIGFTDEVYNRYFPDGGPFGEGVEGWAMLHRRVAASSNVFEDPRYDKTRDFAALVGIASAAAAPVELDNDLHGALLICYAEPREFTPEELTRLERLAQQTELAIRSVRQRESLARLAFETALALTEAIESRDPYTGDHCRRLAEYAGIMAGRAGAAPEGDRSHTAGRGAARHGQDRRTRLDPEEARQADAGGVHDHQAALLLRRPDLQASGIPDERVPRRVPPPREVGRQGLPRRPGRRRGYRSARASWRSSTRSTR